MNCPECGKSWIAEIRWGYFPCTDVIQDKLDKKEITLGGCLVTDNDPKWECNNCHHQWGERED